MSAPKTEKIVNFVEKLEDLLQKQGNKEPLPEYCDADPLQQSFVQLTRDQQEDILQFTKHIFRDHLYGVYDETSVASLNSDLDDLMQSLTNRVRATRKKQRRKRSRKRGFYSEGE
ncbi:unnamed protein product, partial [Gongylonema pulchrum]|uniref:Interferon gamma n=1 Tax=Gongylonema pulchrum TaxID=637853 RepID=A0A183DK79_9BILA